jgi:hypothetical protein
VADLNWISVTYGNGLFVAIAQTGTGNRVMTSPDGITWTQRSTPTDRSWISVTYGNNLFVAVADGGGTGNRVMTSPDGITWTARASAANNVWNSVTYGNGLYVAVASSGTGNRVMTSPDGITWTARTSAANNSWNSVTYGNGLFVAVSGSGSGNRVMTSSNGTTWTSRNSAADNEWRNVTYGNGLFVAVALSGTGNRVMTSPDGINWTIRTSAADNNWRSVTYGNGLYVAVAFSGLNDRVMTSPDGITWTTRSSASDNNWKGVTFGNNIFVAVADGGGTGNRVMTSSLSIAADAPVITAATLGTSATVNFTQSSLALAPAITNYQYSTDNGSNWTAVSPAATTSPLTITGLATVPSSMMIRAVNSAGNSCASNTGCANPAVANHGDAATTNIVAGANSIFVSGEPCKALDGITPNGANPVSGSVTSKVFVQPSTPTFNGRPYLLRHYEITPATNAATATARITLYATQAEFDAFNDFQIIGTDLPTGPTDLLGIAELRIFKYNGTSSDGSGTPGTYSQPGIIIDPADDNIIWNSTLNRWEISFDVTGFSGFFMGNSANTILPLSAVVLEARQQNGLPVLNWSSAKADVATYELQRSRNGHQFTTVYKVVGNGVDTRFTHTDATPATGTVYYRVVATDRNGSTRISNVAMLKGSGAGTTVSIYPNPVTKAARQLQFSVSNNTVLSLRLLTATGVTVLQKNGLNMVGSTSITLPEALGAGIYFLQFETAKGRQVQRVVVE